MKGVAFSIWINGLSGAGKTTLALEILKELKSAGHKAKHFDGDIVRKGLCANLGYSSEDRAENLRRVAEVNMLFMDEGYILVNSFIAPTEAARDVVRNTIGLNNILEIYLNTPIEICIQRDPKGLYSLVKSGKILGMTGIHADFEENGSAALTIDTSYHTIRECIDQIMPLVQEKMYPNFALAENL